VIRRTFLTIAPAAALAACGKKRVAIAPPPPFANRPAPRLGATERGMASWYGRPYHGRPAADGEIYNMETLVAAHRTLPFQTMVRVRNLTNQETVDVRIIDRGPFVAGRIIDLSHAAARAIDLIGPGTAEVEITVIETLRDPEPALFAVQVGAFRDKNNADRLERNMASTYGAGKSVLRDGDPPLWRVLAGRVNSTDDAEMLAQRIRSEQNVPEAFVVRLDPDPPK
jgi:rare lipoprotein A